MNILYLKEEELGIPLYRSDARYGHITRVLRKKQGEIIAAGCSDGSLGSASTLPGAVTWGTSSTRAGPGWPPSGT